MPRVFFSRVNGVIKRKEDGKIDKQWLIFTIIVAVFVILFLFGGVVIAYELKYQNKFFPGSRVGDISLEGLTAEEGLAVLDQITRQIEKEGIKIIYEKDGDLHVRVTPTISALGDPDLSREILSFDNYQTISQAIAHGRSGKWWQNLLDQVNLILRPKKIEAIFVLEEEALEYLLQQEFSELEQPAENTRPEISWESDNYQIEIIEEQSGSIVDYNEIITTLKNNLKQLNNSQIELKQIIDEPKILKSEVMNKQFLIEEILATTTPQLTYEKNQWNIKKQKLATMLEFQREKEEIRVGLHYDTFESWTLENIAPQINIEPRDASVEFSGGRITKLITHRDGLEINIRQTYESLNKNLLAGELQIEIVVRVIKPEIITEEVNDMGIKEIIGTGHSNFAGSPANRRHNIANGAITLHGILIKPGEEFSLIQALGNIDASTGYLQELVIKDNRTTPEYGGGLCQIGTTIFRAAMASGLPITERRNHSYNVSYYLENGLPGTDATIYIPHPDVRFINDTGHYILIQRRIIGNDLYFDFWGTEDGRLAERTTPEVWGWTSPPETKYVETTELAVGAQKCTESSHKGVSASFDYIITYADGEKKETTFSSRYKPWQAVCLIGVEELSGETATSTEE